jgi:hypothetical protein
MKKIIIHCGMPKTGSSALQVQLAQSRKNLLKYGYDYLLKGDFTHAEQGRITSGNGVELARSYLNPEHAASLASRRDELTETFRQMIAETDNHVILSSEFYSAIPRPLLGELAASLSDLGEVQLVFFVREQINALASTYIQQVKRHMLTQFPDEYFADWDGPKSPTLAYNSYFSRLAEVAPAATILTKPYELSKTHSAGLMGLFLDMIGAEIPADDLPKDSRINLSPSPQEIRLMIEVNKHHPRMQFSDMLVEGSHAAGRSNIHAQHAILPPEVAAKISTFFQADNEAFFRDFANCENLYENTWEVAEFIDLREVEFDATSVVEILSGLLVNLDRRLALLENQ